MKKYLPHIWKIYLALLLIYIFKMYVEMTMRVGPFRLSAINHYYLAYFVFIVGLVGLSFKLRLGNRGIWKFVFGVALIYFTNYWIVSPVSFVLLHPDRFIQMVMMQARMAPLLFLLAALYIYGWKSDELWSTDAQGLHGNVASE